MDWVPRGRTSGVGSCGRCHSDIAASRRGAARPGADMAGSRRGRHRRVIGCRLIGTKSPPNRSPKLPDSTPG